MKGCCQSSIVTVSLICYKTMTTNDPLNVTSLAYKMDGLGRSYCMPGRSLHGDKENTLHPATPNTSDIISLLIPLQENVSLHFITITEASSFCNKNNY